MLFIWAMVLEYDNVTIQCVLVYNRCLYGFSQFEYHENLLYHPGDYQL